MYARVSRTGIRFNWIFAGTYKIRSSPRHIIYAVYARTCLYCNKYQTILRSRVSIYYYTVNAPFRTRPLFPRQCIDRRTTVIRLRIRWISVYVYAYKTNSCSVREKQSHFGNFFNGPRVNIERDINVCHKTTYTKR